MPRGEYPNKPSGHFINVYLGSQTTTSRWSPFFLVDVGSGTGGGGCWLWPFFRGWSLENDYFGATRSPLVSLLGRLFFVWVFNNITKYIVVQYHSISFEVCQTIWQEKPTPLAVFHQIKPTNYKSTFTNMKVDGRLNAIFWLLTSCISILQVSFQVTYSSCFIFVSLTDNTNELAAYDYHLNNLIPE